MTGSFFIDTNLLVYAFDNSQGRKHDICKGLLEDIFLSKKDAVLSTQILGEFVHVITSKIKKPLDLDKVHYLLERITKFDNIKIINITSEVVLEAIKISKKYNIHYWDAQIAASMLKNECLNILTENTKDFSKVTLLSPENPFMKT